MLRGKAVIFQFITLGFEKSMRGEHLKIKQVHKSKQKKEYSIFFVQV